MKLKTAILSLFFLFFTSSAFPIMSQDESSEDKSAANSGDKDLSYFSQEEMQFILGTKEQPWNYGRLSVSPYYLIGIGDLASTVPYITGFILVFDHGIHHAFKPVYRKKSPFLPGLRFEAAFNIFGPTSINALSITGGIEWLFPINSGRGGEIVLSSTAGMSFMRGQIGSYYYVNDSFYLTATLGYELSFSRIFISLQGRFSYVYDETFPLMGAGGSLGVGYRFPSATTTEKEGEN